MSSTLPATLWGCAVAVNTSIGFSMIIPSALCLPVSKYSSNMWHCCLRPQEHAAAVQSGVSALACAASDGQLEATVAALLARRCLSTGQGEPGETGQRVLLDEVLAAVAAAVPSLQPQLLQPLRGLLQHQARSTYGASACTPAAIHLVCTVILWLKAITVPILQKTSVTQWSTRREHSCMARY